MSITNGSGIAGWDADTVPWNAVRIVASFGFHSVYNDHLGDPLVNCSYDTVTDISSSGSHTWTFVREAFRPALDPTAGNLKWMTVGGLYAVGEGANVPPFFRSCYSQLIGRDISNSIATGIVLLMDSDSYTETTAITYPLVGPNVGGCPGNPSPSTSTGTGLWTGQAKFTQSGSQIIVEGTIFSPVGGSGFTVTRMVDVSTLKYGGSIDLGSSNTSTPANPDPSHYTTWAMTEDIQVITI